MKLFKSAVCGLLAIAAALCLFACGKGEKTVKLETGTSAIAVEHHGRTVYGEALIPAAESFPVVIFSHGFNGYQDDFKGIAEALVAEGVGALTFTFCGSGPRDRSGFPTTEMTLETERDDLIALIDYARRIEGFNGKLFLFGGSQGGMVSALAAQRRGEEVSGMILLYPAFGIRDDWNAMFPKSQYPDDDSLPETVYNFNGWGVDLGKGFIRSARKVDVFSKMPAFSDPVLIFHGDNDAVVNIRYSKQATGKGGYPNSKLIEYANFVHGAQPSLSDVETKILPLIREGKLPED